MLHGTIRLKKPIKVERRIKKSRLKQLDLKTLWQAHWKSLMEIYLNNVWMKVFEGLLMDVSPFFMSMGMSTDTNDFLFPLMMFPMLYCFHFILSKFILSIKFFDFILHPNFYFYIKTWILLACLQVSTMVQKVFLYKFFLLFQYGGGVKLCCFTMCYKILKHVDWFRLHIKSNNFSITRSNIQGQSHLGNIFIKLLSLWYFIPR